MVFERLFGDGDSTDADVAHGEARKPEERAGLRHRQPDAAAGPIGAADKRKLDEYMEAVRDIERRIQLAEQQNLTIQLPNMERPSSIPDDYAEYPKLMLDMQVVAWQTDMTRVTGFMLGRDGSNRAYREIGISDGHHSISHHQGDAERLEKLMKIDDLHVQMFAYLLKRLNETPDGDGSLLDHSLICFGSSLSESNQHTHDQLPIILAGLGSGQVKGGPAHRREAGNAAEQPVPQHVRLCGRAERRAVRRQHRPVDESLTVTGA